MELSLIHIFDNHHACAFLSKAFDPLARAMLLLRFADKKAIDFAAGHSHRHHHRVGSHG